MNQLFFNILSNALKFTAPGKICEIEVSCRPLPEDEKIFHDRLDKSLEYVEIVFRDNGIGFDPEFAEQIFTIFQRLNDNESYSGTGIGLALCRKIVRNHGGEIFAKSKVGEGSAFYVILPAHKPTEVNAE
jgi:signal transduction histidine kinase